MSLDAWLAAQEAVSAQHIAAAVSATTLRHTRPVFAQTVVPAPGSVLASPRNALWDPEPDYFYHWPRDAAVVMSVVPLLRAQDEAVWDARVADYVRFSLAIATRRGPPANPLRATTGAEHERFLRPDAELAALTGDALLGEPRANADGGPDLERWGRPQFDGPALRALSCLRWPGPVPDEMEALLALDLGHVLRHAALPAIGPWEEEPAALHAFTLLAQRAALRAGVGRIPPGPVEQAVSRIEVALDTLWCEDETGGHMRASSMAAAGDSDANIILGVLLDATAAPFGVRDPRVAATAAHIEGWSRELYPIATEAAPLVGRWPGDVYFGGNPWLPTSFGHAEFHFRRATLTGDADEARAAIGHADAILAAVSRCLPAAGALPEQLDRSSGAPVSSRDLTWSHAALIAAGEARRAALARWPAA